MNGVMYSQPVDMIVNVSLFLFVLPYSSLLGNLLVCSALSIVAHAAPWTLMLMMSLPVSLGFLSP